MASQDTLKSHSWQLRWAAQEDLFALMSCFYQIRQICWFIVSILGRLPVVWAGMKGPFRSSIGHAAAMAPIDTTAPLPRLTHVMEQRSRGWMPNVLCELLGAGQSRDKWRLMKHSMCPVTACTIAYYDKLCWRCNHYFTLLHIITFDTACITTCYYNDYYYIAFYIFLHCYYLLLHLSLLPVITELLS